MTVSAIGVQDGGASAPATERTPLLRVADLRVEFTTPRDPVLAVNGIDLEVFPGEVLALVGESGSGKSVSMLSVMGLLPTPPATVTGSISFEGRELTQLPPSDMRDIRGNEMAMVFQDPMSSLNPVHTVGKQISESLRLHRAVPRNRRRKRVVELLDLVGIPDPKQRADDFPHEFSGGMRQRAMIAMALACNPKLLIADEPTTALDVTVQSQIVELVRQLQSDIGMSVVWITHDLGVVAELADRVAVMYAGRIMETGSSTEVYRHTRHPYTSGLLRSIPRLDGPVSVSLPEIPGSPRTVSAPLTSCAFEARCPMSETGCNHAVPELLPTDRPRHLSACIHSDVLAGDSVIAWDAGVAVGVGSRPTDGETIVEVRDLEVHFPVVRGITGSARSVVRAVDGVDLDVRRGRTLGVVGESGCGKTTLGRALVGLVGATAGEIQLDGVAINTKPGPARRRIQMIFQDPFSSMNPGMRVEDVISEPVRIHQLLEGDAVAEKVAALLAQVGLPPDVGRRFPHEFSGGQRQRIAVARALAAEPDVIVCDEAVSALDVSVQAQIVNLLRTLQQEEGLAFLFIAHDLAVVRHISHEVAVMYLGQIVERAPRDDLYSDPLHPYTQALLAAVPSPEPVATAASRPPPLTGDLPSPMDPPAGCRFHTRCPVAVAGLCDKDQPTLRQVAEERWVACHLVETTVDGTPVAPPTFTPDMSTRDAQRRGGADHEDPST